MPVVLEIVANEAAKLVTAALVGEAGGAAKALVKVVRRKLGKRPPSVAAIAEAARSDREFEKRLYAALFEVNAGPVDLQPAGIADFRDRLGLLTDPPDAGIRLICGPDGTGRGELARQFADLMRHEYPSRLIEIDLAALRIGDVLDVAQFKRRLLRALGIADADILADDAGLDEQLQTALATRARRIILYDVVSARDLKPLLPFRHNLVLATTAVLTGEMYEIDRAPIEVRGLDEPGATELLADHSGDVSPYDEEAATGELLDLCGRTPAVIQQLGRTLRRYAGEPRPVAALHVRYRRTGLINGEADLKQLAALQFERLDPDVVSAATLLAGFPGGAFSRRTADAYLAEGRLFERVLDAQLTEPRDGEWHRLSPLVLEYAAILPTDRESAFDRLLIYLRDRAVAADLAGDEPGRHTRLREYRVPSVRQWDDDADGDRLGWLDDHFELLDTVVREAHQRGRHNEVCQVVGAIEVLLNQNGRWHQYDDLVGLAIESATALGSKALLARMLMMRGRGRFLRHAFQTVPADLAQARELIEQADVSPYRKQRLRASLAEFEARFREEWVEVYAAEPERSRLLGEAESSLRVAVGIDRDIDDLVAMGIHLRMLIGVLVKAGRPDEALAEIDRALAVTTGRNRHRLEMAAARAHLNVGDAPTARAWWTQAKQGMAALKADQYDWELQELEALLFTAEGDVKQARRVWADLVNRSFASGHPRSNGYLSRLESLPEPRGFRWR